MVPDLRRLILALLLPLLGPAVRACPFCDPAAPVPENGLPNAPFDSRVPPGLLPAEEAFLSAYQGGRYGLVIPRLVDSRDDQTSVGHLLSNEGAQVFFKAHAEKVAAELREKLAKGTLSAVDRDLALQLFWERGPLLAEREREFLASLNPTRLGRAPPEPATRRPDALVAGPAAQAAEAALVDRLKASLELIDHGDANERVELNLALERMLESPTARTLAERLLKQGKKVRIYFGEVVNSKVIEVNGKKIIEASGGNTDSSGDMVRVLLNKDFLGTDPEFRAAYPPGTLAHELLGHGLGALEASKAGVEDTYSIYRDNEAGAGLVGWIVDAERGTKLTNSHMWRYIDSPESYHQGLKTNLPYYAGTFSTQEMSAPVPVLTLRLAAAKTALGDLPEQSRVQSSWEPIIDHFVSKHGMKAESFSSLRQAVSNYVDVYTPARTATLNEIVGYVQGQIEHYGTEEGKAEAERMGKDAGKPFFTEAEAELEARRRHLITLTRGKSRAESFAPPAPGQMSWQALTRIYEKDRTEHPEHWK